MPYRHAHWYLLSLFPLATLAFWPSYLSQFTSSSMELHAHGITATLWLMLLAAQSWTIHHDGRQLHRTLGLASLALFPLFLIGGTGIFIGMAQRLESGSPFHTLYAARLAWLDIVGMAGFAYFYFQALRQRRKVHPHSRYMLGTVFPLLPPIFGRLSAIPLGVTGPQDFWKLGYGFQAANLLTAAIAFYLGARAGRHGGPFHLAGALMLLAALLYQTVGGTAAWQSFYAGVAHWPWLPLAFAAGIAGVGIAYVGWTSGRRAMPLGAAVAAE